MHVIIMIFVFTLCYCLRHTTSYSFFTYGVFPGAFPYCFTRVLCLIWEIILLPVAHAVYHFLLSPCSHAEQPGLGMTVLTHSNCSALVLN